MNTDTLTLAHPWIVADYTNDSTLPEMNIPVVINRTHGRRFAVDHICQRDDGSKCFSSDFDFETPTIDSWTHIQNRVMVTDEKNLADAELSDSEYLRSIAHRYGGREIPEFQAHSNRLMRIALMLEGVRPDVIYTN